MLDAVPVLSAVEGYEIRIFPFFLAFPRNPDHNMSHSGGILIIDWITKRNQM